MQGDLFHSDSMESCLGVILFEWDRSGEARMAVRGFLGLKYSEFLLFEQLRPLYHFGNRPGLGLI